MRHHTCPRAGRGVDEVASGIAIHGHPCRPLERLRVVGEFAGVADVGLGRQGLHHGLDVVVEVERTGGPVDPEAVGKAATVQPRVVRRLAMNPSAPGRGVSSWL